ncbi:MAG: hypothetical protein HDT30_03505 [Clostridiales bacterium]|nr:hypothetical protein [Clostridiales bacterium]
MSRMNKKDKIAAKKAAIEILNEYGIKNLNDFNSQDDEEGDEMYGYLKAGVLEEFDLDDEDMDELLYEILS